MATFWAAVAQNTSTSGAAGGAATAVATGGATIKPRSDHKDRTCSPRTEVGNNAYEGSADGDVSQKRWEAQQGPGPGGALSTETASRCLNLLADARDAYEGHGFSQQADGAGRCALCE